MTQPSHYERNNQKYVRVSSVIGQLSKPFLVNWASNCAVDYIQEAITVPHSPIRAYEVLEEPDTFNEARTAHERIKNESAAIGTEVHDIIQRYLETGHAPLPSCGEVDKAFQAFCNWWDKNGVKFIDSEKVIWHDELKYAGKYDLKVELKQGVYILDIKVTNRLYRENNWQVAAYRSMEKTDGGGILRLDKVNAKAHFKDVTSSHDEDYAIFLKLLELYRLLHKEK